MPRYFFDQRNGRRIVDANGVNCSDDAEALAVAKCIAAGMHIDNPTTHKRYVAILNDAGDEVDKVPVLQTVEGESA